MIAELLKATRVENKLTQKQLGAKSGVSYVCINRIERGQLPRLAIVQKLFEAMDCTLEMSVVPKYKQLEIPLSAAEHNI